MHSSAHSIGCVPYLNPPGPPHTSTHVNGKSGVASARNSPIRCCNSISFKADRHTNGPLPVKRWADV